MQESIPEKLGISNGVGRIIQAIGSIAKVSAGERGALSIEERISLGPKKTLYLVRCRHKEFLIAAGADSILSMIEVAAGCEHGEKARRTS